MTYLMGKMTELNQLYIYRELKLIEDFSVIGVNIPEIIV